MKIIIKKLNNSRDYEIDTDDKCNIFVGNNGCGKSTAMNILFYLSNNDMRLLNYCFDEIEICNDSQKINKHIKYSDLLPSIDLYKELYSNGKMIFCEDKEDEDLSYIDYKNKYGHNIFINDEEFNYFITCLKKYKDYDINLYKKLFMLTNQYLFKSDNIYSTASLKIDTKKDKFFQNYLLFMPSSIKYSLLRNNVDVTCFLKQLLYSYHVVYSNYESHSHLNGFINSNVQENIPGLVFINQYESIIENDIENDESRLDYVSDFFEVNDKSLSFKEQLEEYKKYILSNKVLPNYWTNCSPHEVQSEINIQNILYDLLHDGQLIKDFINEYIQFVKEYQYCDSLKHEYSEKVMLIYEYYIKPFISKGSLLDYSNFNTFFDMYKYDMIYELVDRFGDKIINYINESLKEMNNLIKEYFVDKTIFLTPKGVVISKNNDFKDDIKFEQLSVGEKRLLALIINCYYHENYLFLIDEPESSLSVVLQKRLLPDLLKSNNNFLIATQSPYIVDDYDELYNYVTWIDGDDRNE